MIARTLRLGEHDLVRIGLGTNRLNNTPAAVTFVRDAVSAGVNFIDTAHVYADGESEQTLGAALTPIPEGCVIGTKGAWGAGNGRPDILRSEVDESLSRLRTQTITLYYLHRIDPDTPVEQSLATLGEYREAGAILNIGLCEVSVDEVEQARQVVPITAVQNHYNLSERKHEEVVDYCAREGILFVPFFPLAGDGGGTLVEIVSQHDATQTQIKLAWLLRRSPTMLPIPGTLSIEHLRENLGALEIELTEDEFEALA